MKTKLFFTLAISAFAMNVPLMAMENLDAPRRGATVEEQNEKEVAECLSLLNNGNHSKDNFMDILMRIQDIKYRTPDYTSESFTYLLSQFRNFINRSTLDKNNKDYLLSELETIAPEAKNFAKNVPVSIKSTSKNNPQIGGQNKGASPEKGKCPPSMKSIELQFLAQDRIIPIPLDQEENDRYKAPDKSEREKISRIAIDPNWKIALDVNKMSQEKGNMCHYQATLSSWFSTQKIDFTIEKINYNENRQSSKEPKIPPMPAPDKKIDNELSPKQLNNQEIEQAPKQPKIPSMPVPDKKIDVELSPDQLNEKDTNECYALLKDKVTIEKSTAEAVLDILRKIKTRSPNYAEPKFTRLFFIFQTKIKNSPNLGADMQKEILSELEKINSSIIINNQFPINIMQQSQNLPKISSVNHPPHQHNATIAESP